MGFSLKDGEKYVILSGSGTFLERVYKHRPVWNRQITKAKLYSSRESAQNIIDCNNFQGTVHQFKDLAIPVYIITRVPNEKKKILANLLWINRNSNYQCPPYYLTREKAQEALEREKLNLISEYHDIIMYCKDLKLPEFK